MTRDFYNVVNLFCLKVILDKVDFLTWLQGFELFLEAQEHIPDEETLNKLAQALTIAKLTAFNSVSEKDTYQIALAKLINFKQTEINSKNYS